MEKKKKKIILAISTFFLSFVCLVGSSFAWYSVGREGDVDMFQLQIGNRNEELLFGLQLKDEQKSLESLKEKYSDEEAWSEDIYYVKEINQELLLDFGYLTEESSLLPISSAYERNWLKEENGKIDIEQSDDYPRFTSMPTQSNKKGEGFLSENRLHQEAYQFEFFVKADRPYYMFLDQSTSFTSKDEDVLQALRISMYSKSTSYANYSIYEPLPSYDEQKNYIPTSFCGRLDLYPKDFYYDYFEGKEILYGDYAHEESLTYTTNSLGNQNSDANNGNVSTKEGIEAIDMEKSIENGLVTYQERKPILPSMLENKEEYESILTNALLYVDGKEATPFVATIYAEGWDKDCSSKVANATFDISLTFSVQEPRHFF